MKALDGLLEGAKVAGRGVKAAGSYVSRNIGRVGAGIAAVSAVAAYHPSEATAGDLFSVTEISLPASVRADGDGDGIADIVDSSPTLYDAPNAGEETIYDLTTVEQVSSGEENVTNVDFNFPLRVTYLETDSNFENGTIYMKPISNNMETERTAYDSAGMASRDLTNLTPRTIERGPFLGSSYVHSDAATAEIHRINLTTENVRGVIPRDVTPVDPGMEVTNPSIAAGLVISNGELALADNLTLVGETSSSEDLYGFDLHTSGILQYGLWDETDPTRITDFGNPVGDPVVDRTGDRIMAVERVSPTNDALWVYNGLESIAAGSTSPYVGDDWVFTAQEPRDPRGDKYGDGDGAIMPGGFLGVGDGAIAVYAQDVNGVFNTTAPLASDSFVGTDFDLFFAPVVGDGSTLNPFGLQTPVRYPLPGNQIFPSTSPEGGRIAFSDDSLDGTPGGNFNGYVASVGTFGVLSDSSSGTPLDLLDGLRTPFGLEVRGNSASGERIRCPLGSERVIEFSTPIRPIADAAQARSFLTTITEIAPPAGYFFDQGVGMRLRRNYDSVNLSTDSGVIDDTTLDLVHQVASGEEFTDASSTEVDRERDGDGNGYIEYVSTDFSPWALQGDLFETTPVSNWQIWR